MPTPTTTFKLLLISPSDVQEERQAVVDAVERWNATTGLNLRAQVATTRWEFARPDMSAPSQEVINRQLVVEADFGIAVFWARLGSPTETHPSGSAEEVERLLARGANVMVYFSAKPVPHELLRDDQYDKLQELRRGYEKRGLLATFPSAEKLGEVVSLHLTGLVSGLLTKERAADQPVPSIGSMTAPKPDVRVLVGAGVAGHDEVVPRLIIEVQNHSPVDFFFSGLRFALQDGGQVAVAYDALFHRPVYPEKIQSGDGRTIVVDVEALAAELKGKKLGACFVTDKIDRRYFAPDGQTEAAFASVKQQLATWRKPRGR